MFIVFFIINLLGKVDKEVCFKMLNKENTHDACKASQVLEDKVV